VGTADASGAFTRGYALQPQVSIGLHTLTLTVPSFTGPPGDTVEFEVVPWPVEISIRPDEIHPGTEIRIVAEGLPPLSPFIMRLDSDPIASGTANSSGEASVYYQVPKNISLAPRVLSVTTPGYSGPPSDSIQINITQWPVKISVPAEAHPASSIPVVLSGLPPNAACDVYLDSKLVYSNKSDAQGTVQTQVWLSMWTNLGFHSISCTVPGYTGPPSAEESFEVTQWPTRLQLSPAVVHPGSSIHIQGSEFPPRSTCRIFLDASKIWEGLSGEDGALDVWHSLQRNISLGVHSISVLVAFPGNPTAESSVQVSQWPLSISVSPPAGEPGETVILNGTGYPPESKVRILWDGKYVKAAMTFTNGSLSTQLVAPSDLEQRYYRIEVEVEGGFTGPPRTYAFFWLGRDPPERSLWTTNSSGSSRNVFYPPDGVYVLGEGNPPSETADLYVLRGGERPDPSKAFSVTTLSTDLQGRIWGNVFTAGQTGTYGLWMDLNRNGVLDNSDIWIDNAFYVQPRPDVALLNASIDDLQPTQGQRVTVVAKVLNKGQLVQRGSVLFLFGDQIAARAEFEVDPGQTVQVSLLWDTSYWNPSNRSGLVLLPGLDGEIDLADNQLSLGSILLLPRPNLSARWLLPLRREVKKGQLLTVKTRIANGAAASADFSVDLLWDGQAVCGAEVRLSALESRTVVLHWDTSSSNPGSGELAVCIEVLPFEVDPSDNYLANGTVRVLPPNVPPTADPLGPYRGVAGMPVRFDASWSYDIDGRIVSYSWDFGDGTRATEIVVNHTYREAGSYPVTLTVWDDDGASSTSRTTCTVSAPPATYNLTVFVQDAFNGQPLSGAMLEIDGVATRLQGSSFTVRLTGGSYAMSASLEGYQEAAATVDLEADSEVFLKLVPAIQIVPCGFFGVERHDFSSADAVYARVDSPGEYLLRIWIVEDGSARDGGRVVDSTGQGARDVVFPRGRSVIPVWTMGLRPGGYDLLVDVNGDGVYQAHIDLLERKNGPLFTVPEIGLLLTVSMLVPLVARRRNSPHRQA